MDGFAEGYAVGADKGRDCMNNNNGFGGDWIGLIAILALAGGGLGGFGGNRGGNCGCGCNPCCGKGGYDDIGYHLGKTATHEDLTDISILNKEDTIIQGQFGLQQSLCGGFAGVTAAVNQLGYQNQMCCCGIERSIDGVRYEAAKNTGDIINAGNHNTQQILNFLTQNKIDDYRDKNAALYAEVSQYKQNQYLESKLKPCPVPAYITCNPNCPTPAPAPFYPPYVPAPFYGNNCHKNDCGCNPCGNVYGII